MIKELIILLLLVLAILLVLGVFLYEYIPTNKVVPKIETYEAPNSIKEELEQTVQDEDLQSNPIVYEINNSDLNIYEKTKDYKKGKVNPFGDTSSDVNSNTVSGNTVTDNGNSNSSTSNSNSEGNYLPKSGTK